MMVAERLFLPPEKDESRLSDAKVAGLRISKRLQKQQQEREAARKFEGTFTGYLGTIHTRLIR